MSHELIHGRKERSPTIICDSLIINYVADLGEVNASNMGMVLASNSEVATAEQAPFRHAAVKNPENQVKYQQETDWCFQLLLLFHSAERIVHIAESSSPEVWSR